MVSQAIKAMRPSLVELAKLAKIPYHTLRSYRLDRRTASEDVVKRLAIAMRQHAAELKTLADGLDAEAERETRDARE